MGPEKRRHDRLPSSVEASCYVKGRPRRVWLSEVSRHGCRAEMMLRGAIPGERILIKLSELLVLPATVVWIREPAAGLEFANPLHGAMLRQFVQRRNRPDSLH